MTSLSRFTTSEASAELLAEIRDLLFDTFAERFSEDDWQHCLGGDHVVLRIDGAVVAHAAVVHRTIRVASQPLDTGYVEGVATETARHGQGLGSTLMAATNDVVREKYDLGALSTSRTSFYTRLGWESWRGPSFVIREVEPIRTADEDDGIMVLRFGRSATADLTSSIACEARSGDDW